LLMISAEIGAIVGGGTMTERLLLREFARKLGCAFQIQDDLLDMSETSGKTFASDILRKKKTFLFVHALNSAAEADKKIIKKIYRQPQVSQADVVMVNNIFRKTGSLEMARQEVTMRLNETEQLAAQLKSSPAKDDLLSLLPMF